MYLKYSGTKIFHPLLAQVHIICDTLSPREYTLQIYCEHFCIFCKTWQTWFFSFKTSIRKWQSLREGELFSDLLVVYMTPRLILQEGYIRKMFKILIVYYDATCTICNIFRQCRFYNVKTLILWTNFWDKWGVSS